MHVTAVFAFACVFISQTPPAPPVAAPPRPPVQAPAAPVPGLAVGEKAPDAQVQTTAGVDVQLADLYGKQPLVIVFDRGGWCQPCARQLTEWGRRVDEITALGAQVILISPEKPESVATSVRYGHLKATAFSDIKMEATKNFQILFQFDEKARNSYKGYGIDLIKKNAGGTWELPAPSVFVIDQAGVIRWKFSDWDYHKRAQFNEVLSAVKALNAPPPEKGE